MWTAWDYLGEAGLGAWAYTEDARAFNKPFPWLLADTGAIDILGNPGAEAEYAATVWGFRAKPWIGVRPVNQNVTKLTKSMWRRTDAIASWAWKNCEGSKAVVEVYTGAHTVELQLNGKCIGRKRVKACRAVFNTRYAPGKLAAVSFDSDGNELSRSELQSTRGKISIRIRPEKGIVSVGDIVYITVELAGENDVVECNADTKIDVSVEGGELLAFGSANPHTPENYTSGSFTTYYGKAQAVVGAEKAGTIRITMRSGDMLNASAEIKAIDQNMT
jgi:hypothetical protein